MSRLAKKPIIIPDGISLEVSAGELRAKGPKGERVLPVLPHTSIVITGNEAMVTSGESHLQARANLGTMWSLTHSAIVGVADGFTKKLEIEGVGYKAALEGKTLVISLGYVHPIRFDIPDGITITVEKNLVTISGVNKELVGSVASQIRGFKKPEPYKGKGIRYQGEVIIRKVGKKAATAAS
jgi:large subunit ribosomal protein L6